jgi:hypothetical protein
LWRDRVAKEGIGVVWDIASGRGRKPSYGKSRIARLVKSTLQDKPQGSTHWSTRAMAKAQGISKSTVQRIWDDHQLKPHLTRSFKLSRDPHFVEKLTDIIGVYLTPPQNAIVLCVDEKSQIQALDRTQPGLPLKPGRCGTFTTITNAMAPQLSLPPYRWPRDGSSGSATNGTGTKSSSDSSSGWTGSCRRAKRCT